MLPTLSDGEPKIFYTDTMTEWTNFIVGSDTLQFFKDVFSLNGTTYFWYDSVIFEMQTSSGNIVLQGPLPAKPPAQNCQTFRLYPAPDGRLFNIASCIDNTLYKPALFSSQAPFTDWKEESLQFDTLILSQPNREMSFEFTTDKTWILLTDEIYSILYSSADGSSWQLENVSYYSNNNPNLNPVTESTAIVGNELWRLRHKGDTLKLYKLNMEQ